LYSKEKKRERTLKIKELGGQLKSLEKQKGSREKSRKEPKSPMREKKLNLQPQVALGIEPSKEEYSLRRHLYKAGRSIHHNRGIYCNLETKK
jgi:hypothetical protein